MNEQIAMAVIDNHICDNPEVGAKRILELIEKGDDSVVVWEYFADWDAEALAQHIRQIIDAVERGLKVSRRGMIADLERINRELMLEEKTRDMLNTGR